MAKKIDPVALVTELCMALPGAENKPFGGHEAPAFRVRDKIFVKVNEDLSGFTCKAPPGVQEVLVQSEPNRFYVPDYVGRNGWIGVRFVDVDRDELAAIVTDSYRMTAPKRLLSELD
ncbi:MAG: MmcQ/YjbR family DNA-binding protein [Acidimicrobiales bacterium]